MSTSDGPGVSGRLFIIDQDRAQTERRRRLLQGVTLILIVCLALMIAYALNARSLGNHFHFNWLIMFSPLPLFAAIETWLASRKGAMDRVHSIELFDGYCVAHPLYSRDLRIDYRDIADILVRYRGQYAHYDFMSLLLTMRNGETYHLGRCDGEMLERLAAELRNRRLREDGKTPGSAKKDRAFRLGQRQRTSHWAFVFFFLCGLGFVARLMFIEYEQHLVRKLEREGTRVEARMTTQFPNPDHVLVFYLFQAPDGHFEKGGAKLPLDSDRRLRQGSTIPVLYFPADPTVHRGVGALPIHSPWKRWLGWAAAAAFFCIAFGCRSGWDALMFRGKLRLVPKGKLVEDSLLKTKDGR